MEIRTATPKDIGLIRELARKSFPRTYRELLSAEQIAYMMDWMYSEKSLTEQMANGHIFRIASENGVPVGYVSVEKQGETLFHLHRIYLLPEAQGKGFGKELFECAVALARELAGSRPCRIELNVNRYNTRAVEFYKKRGMFVTFEGDMDIGDGFLRTDYIMALDLA